MRVKLIRKLLVISIVIISAFSTADCKKQAKCGCNGDALFTLTNAQARVVWNEAGTTIYFTLTDDPYSTYNFCNPEEMFPKLADSKSGDILQVSGEAFWNCNYTYQASNYSYYSMYQKVYDIHVTNVFADLYGKKGGPSAPLN
ncbi:MAG TPA: hypothetical protein VHO68_03050 [Bacteroidales bacterium]|nr:hypothetical protein [Bacteroidales bacterium]